MNTNNSHTICTTCGTQLPHDEKVPALCPICNDDRQFISLQGQSWTSEEELKNGHRAKISQVNERLYTLTVKPDFAIGQRAFLLLSTEGNILWDCIPLLDEETIAFIRSKGGLKAIAFSHPHFYSNMNTWAAEFNCPVYIHEGDRSWIFNHGPHVQLWRGGEKYLWNDISLVHVGGHFPGSSMLRIASLSTSGTMLCGDSLYISRSLRHTAVMFSYPNQIPLLKDDFIAFYEKCSKLKFDTLYGATFEGQDLEGNAYEIFTHSINRYKSIYGLA
ncbi:MBL fold metallo-hydrolase [Mucilaginibacter ginsenosidivorans]|uniref:MBL fold metallo-hydrolase n=1 Tax=Mucilaginibacter ginsenosidivorans TaxID=398053 RepID=A0A5B8UVP3_9SPHI|nr:MBL fold metallo-hydrolase [Mucilaginibacter ginsenosidivorans]QEC62958.1 MBL fold metallo-hydrolase [Mucilaginibacter ginsenosidivorans]